MIRLSLCLLFGFILKGFAQDTSPLQGGHTHSPGSTIQATFNEAISSGVSQTIAWRFNETNVCQIILPTGDFIATSYCNSSDDTSYYSNNSVVNANLTSGILVATFTYSNIKEEDYNITLSFWDIANTIQYGSVSDLTVQGCPVQPNSDPSLNTGAPTCCDADCNYYDYNCTATFSCKNGYSGEDVTATCQGNATWNDNIACYLDTLPVTSTQSIESESTTMKTITTENSPGPEITATETFSNPNTSNTSIVNTIGNTSEPATKQRCVCENNEPIYSGDRTDYSSVIAFSVCLSVEVIVVIIVVLKIGLKKCIVMSWVVLFYAISVCLIIIGLVLAILYEENCCGNNTQLYIGIAFGTIGIIGCFVGIILHIIGEHKKAAFLYCCCCRADDGDDSQSTYSCICGGKFLCKCGCSKSSGTCCCCCIVTENQVGVEKREYEMGSTNNSPPATAQ